MQLRKYKKIFGVGPFGAINSVALLVIAWWIDHILGHVPIWANALLMQNNSSGANGDWAWTAPVDRLDITKLLNKTEAV